MSGGGGGGDAGKADSGHEHSMREICVLSMAGGMTILPEQVIITVVLSAHTHTHAHTHTLPW